MINIWYNLCRALAAMAFLLLPPAICATEIRQMQFDKIALPYEANIVENIYKDSYGMMWFATRRGVFSYDGYNTRRLYEGFYHVITEVEKDILCLGGDEGLRWLNLRTEKWIIPYGEMPATGEVRALACHNNKLFAGTKSQGLFCLDLATRTWRHYDLPNGKNDIIYSLEVVNSSLFIAHYNGLACLDSNGRMHDTGITDNVYDVWYDKNSGCLWIGAEHHLLCRNIRNGETRAVRSDTTYNKIIPSPSGDILLASELGLNILNPHTGNIQTISHNASSPRYGLPSNTIHQIYCDGKNIWIATDRGIAVTQTGNAYETIPLPSITHSSDGNVFSNILIDSSGGKWLGGDNGLIHITQHSTKWFKVGYGLKKNGIRCIYEDRDHEIWIATDASIARYDAGHDRFVYYNLADSKGRNANWAYDIHEDNAGRMWIATYMGGMYAVDKKALLASDGNITVKGFPFGKNDNTVSTCYRFFPDDKDILWANTSKGLVSINTRTMEVKLRLNMIIDKMILANGVLWLDVYGKLYKYDTHTNISEKTEFIIKDGMIHAFAYDGNKLWMSTSEGVYYIDSTNGTIHPFSKPKHIFTAGVYVPHEDAILWGGEDMLCRQRLKYEPMDTTPSMVYISSATVEGVPIADYVPRFEDIIRLNGSENIILELTAFAYGKKDVEVFWYKIGRNGEWNSLPNGTNKIIMPHLSGGEYKIYFTTDADHAEASVTEYTLKVPYPWFLRWWAWMLYAMAVTAAVWFIKNYYKRHGQILFEQRERERVMALTQQKIDFFVDMSHELKTPLSLIIAPLSKLLSETSNAKLRNRLKSIYANALRLNELIHRILDSKQLEAEVESQVLHSHIDLVDLISGAMDEFAILAKERSICMTIETPGKPVMLDADTVKVQMIFRNILSNAFKYVNDGTGKIAVSITKTPSEAVVSVSDNGPGVPDSELPKLFKRYYTGQNAREGSGIGLSVVRKYVELHGGEVKAENKDGFKVTFTLPLNAATTSETEATHEMSDKHIILIVDDNREILDFLTSTLEVSYKCLTAQNGEDALKIIADIIPDIIITDQMMPGIDGTALCHHIRHNHSTELVPIIMLTAKDDTDTELKSIRSGADVFMPKPFDLRKLQLHIVQLLNKRKAIEQNVRIKSMTSTPSEETYLTSDEELMEHIISLINSNMHSEEFNVTKLCDLLCIDQKQLYRKLKQLTGETPVSFIRKQRMKRAAVLLKQERFTVSEVMYQVGFSSASYFTKSFTKEFGISPKDYR